MKRRSFISAALAIVALPLKTAAEPEKRVARTADVWPSELHANPDTQEWSIHASRQGNTKTGGTYYVSTEIASGKGPFPTELEFAVIDAQNLIEG